MKLLASLKDDRRAYYQCVIVLVDGEQPPLVAEARWHGEIGRAPRGNNGFGYDPVFLVPERNCTSAELAPEEKNRLSHRGQALRALVAALRQSRR